MCAYHLNNKQTFLQDKLVETLLKPGYFYFGPTSYIMEPYNEYGRSLPNLQFHSIPQTSTGLFGLIFTRKSPFTAIFKVGFQILKEKGQIDYLFKKWVPIEQNLQGLAPAYPVEIRHVIWGFICLPAGYFLALSIMIGEKLFAMRGNLFIMIGDKLFAMRGN